MNWNRAINGVQAAVYLTPVVVVEIMTTVDPADGCVDMKGISPRNYETRLL